MGDKLYEENSVQAIAESIRSKLGVDTTYKIAEMSGAINTIVVPDGTTNITENGYHNVKAYEQAYVHVEGGITPIGTTNIYENGDHDVTDYATAHVAVPQPIGKKTVTENGTDIDIAQYATLDVIVQPNLGTKTVNQNGVYNASDDNLDGYSKVTVTTPVPTGKKTITENGTNIDVSSYALADVIVPQPSGKKIITQNGTNIDIAAYATADVQVNPNVGTKTININGTYIASSDNLDGYSSVTVTVPQPSGNIDINADEYIKTVDVTQYTQATVGNPFLQFSDMYYKYIETTTAELVLDYDTTREVKELTVLPIAYDKDETRSIVSCFYRWSDRINDGGLYKHQIYTADGTNPTESQLTGGYIPSPVFDTTNSTITISGRNTSYRFIEGGVFLIIITYAVIIPNE